MSHALNTHQLLAERRFSGRHATLDAIAQVLDQQLGRLRPTRIELRLADTPKPIHHEAAHVRLHAVLRQHRIEDLAVSVRPFDSALDLAQGEHLLRLLGSDAAAPVASKPAAATKAPERWWHRWWPTRKAPVARFRLEPGAATPSPVPNEPVLSQAEAVAELRRALQVAVGLFKTEPGQGVRALRLTVHAPAAHAPLQALVQLDPQAPAALARLLRTLGVTEVTEPLQVQYRFLPPDRGAATQWAGAGDLKAELFSQPSAEPAVPRHGSTQDVGKSSADPQATALPQRRTERREHLLAEATASPQARPQPMVQLRVMGHSQAGAFARPINVWLKRFPVVLDRATLEGLLRQPEQKAALRSVSNSSPLRIEHGPEGFTLQAPRRGQGGQGGGLALYHHALAAGGPGVPSVGDPLPAVTPLGAEPLRLWLNDPHSAADRTQPAQALPVLWVEVHAITA